MERYWDDTLKKLIRQHPQDFINWLFRGATFEKAVPEERANVKLQVDGLLEVIKDGEPMLLHVEIQTYADADMAERLLEYNVVTHRQLNLPVHSCVIYLLAKGTVPESPLLWKLPGGQKTLLFHFDSIQLAHLTPEQLLALEQPGLLPLLPLTNGGADRTVVDRMFQEIGSQQPELSAIGLTLAAYVFTKSNQADLEWLLKRYQHMNDIIRESPFIQWVLDEGREEGREEGKLVIARKLLLDFVQKRFPDLLPIAQEEATRIESLEVLEALVLKVGLAQSQAEAEEHLQSHKDQ